MKKFFGILAAIIISLICLCSCGTEGKETTTDAVHVHDYGEWQTVKEADCVNAGKRERTCDCGETETEEIPALGHTGGTAENCKSRAVCERCGATYGDYGPHIGGTATCKQRARCELCMHPYGEVDPENHRIIAATCVSKSKCRDCKKEFGDSLDPNNHGAAKGKGIDKICEKCHKSVLPETDASIVDSTNEKPIDFNEYLKKVTDDRVGRLSVPYDKNTKYYPRTDKSKLLTAEERTKYWSDGRTKVNESSFTKEQAFEDIKICFKGFYTFYGPYALYGADKFDSAERKAIEDLNEYFSEGKDLIGYIDLYKIIASSLDFIVDRHSKIWCGKYGGAFSKINKKEYYAYYFKDVIFREDDIGYYTLVQGKKWYLEKVKGGDFSEYLKVTIDENGELVYALVRIANPDAESLEGDMLTLKRGKTEYSCEIVWKMFDVRTGIEGETDAGIRIENGVPILHFRGWSGESWDDINQYTKSGKQMRNQKLFVIDIRSYPGGNAGSQQQMLEDYIGNDVSYPGAFYRIDTKGTGAILNFQVSRFIFQKDPNIKILLADKVTASAGEALFGLHSTFENTLIVGTNTMGCLLSGTMEGIFLPNSKIMLLIGTMFSDRYNEYYKGMNPEGIGLMPDVFVNSTEALDLSMKMIEYYGIEKSKDTSGITTFGTGKR